MKDWPVILAFVFIAIWFASLYWPRKGSGSKVEPVDPILASPELSCFVRGLIKSMKDTPQKWERGEPMRYVYWSSKGVTLWTRDAFNSYVHHVDDRLPVFTRDESKALTYAVSTYLEEPNKARLQQEHAARTAAIVGPFEKLGCPDNTSAQ